MAFKDNQQSSRNIVVSFTEKSYSAFMKDRQLAHLIICNEFAGHPELFPEGMSAGYKLNGKTRISRKLGIQMRKIVVGGVTFQIRPSFVLPYMRAKTADVAGPLFLLRFGVPFWALAYVFGRNAMYWYRLFLSLGKFSLVGTTIHHPRHLPEHVLADEHHTRIRGQKAYIATTIAHGCILGVEATLSACEQVLKKAYQVFKDEAVYLKATYQPKTVNTDGWFATQNVWQTLFPAIFVIECFLHAYLKVRDRATQKLAEFFETAADKIWQSYQAASKRVFSQRLRRLAEWANSCLPDSPMKDNLLKLCAKKKRWLAHLDFPNAYRTSNMLDRIMKFMNRHALNSQMFHSDTKATTDNFRAFALIHNFSPYSPAVSAKDPLLNTPVAKLNGFVYHHNWLQNLMIAASLNGFRQHSNLL